MSIAIGLTIILYLIFVGWVFVGWEKTEEVYTAQVEPSTSFSIVVAVRNEEDNIVQLINDLAVQNYPHHLFEIIIVDDHSADDTLEIAKRIRVQSSISLHIIRLEKGAGKKAAMKWGIDLSSKSWIAATDGDCRIGAGWLASLDTLIVSRQPKMVVGPVLISSDGQLFPAIQQIEFTSLIASAAAGLHFHHPNMCNGANLAVEKNAFYKVGGYSSHSDIPSGDDEFLMHAIWKEYPGRVLFNKNKTAIISTPATDSWQTFSSQRQRWASKWEKYTDWKMKALALLVFAIQANFVVFLVGAILTGELVLFAMAYGIKIVADSFLLYRLLDWFGKPFHWVAFLVLEIFYPFYVVIFALAGRKGTYKWKGRHFK